MGVCVSRGRSDTDPASLVLRDVAGSLDERRKRSQRFRELEERMLRDRDRICQTTQRLIMCAKDAYLQQLRRRGPLLGIDLERFREVVAENRGERLGVRDLRRPVRRDEVQRLERVLVQIWGLALDHL